MVLFFVSKAVHQTNGCWKTKENDRRNLFPSGKGRATKGCGGLRGRTDGRTDGPADGWIDGWMVCGVDGAFGGDGWREAGQMERGVRILKHLCTCGLLGQQQAHLGRWYSRRAIAMRCFSPPLSVSPHRCTCSATQTWEGDDSGQHLKRSTRGNGTASQPGS
eukprot:358164-Chlamydomonas_euryale.AAC.4